MVRKPYPLSSPRADSGSGGVLKGPELNFLSFGSSIAMGLLLLFLARGELDVDSGLAVLCGN